MSSEMMQEILDMIEAEAHSRPTHFEFELAYQTRVAIDRIRFAISQTELAGGRAEQIREAGMQLLDALGRLESVERRFQQRSRSMALNQTLHLTEPSNGGDATR
jgi:hypothetical protein